MAQNNLKQFTFYEDTIQGKRSKKIEFTQMDIIDGNSPEAMSNPFLYTFNNSKILITSIEDFGLNYKKKNVRLHYIIRNPNIKKSKKIKILKKYFKSKRKEFLLNLKKLKDKKEISEKKILELKNTKINLVSKIVQMIIFLANIIIVFLFFKNNYLNNLIYTNNNLLILLIFLIAILSFVVCELLFYTIKYFSFYKKRKTFRIRIKKILRKHKKLFNKVYKKTYKYYLFNINKNRLEFTPLKLNEVWTQKNDLKNVEGIMDVICLKTDEIVRYQKKRNKIFKVVWFFVILTDIALLVLSIVYK